MPEPFAPADPDRFHAALQQFDAANAEDPNLEKVGDDGIRGSSSMPAG